MTAIGFIDYHYGDEAKILPVFEPTEPANKKD